MKRIVTAIACLVFTMAGFGQASRVFNIKDYGAVGDSIRMDTKAIQEAIDACTGAGGGMVRVPAGFYPMGTIRLKSNVTLSLDYGATLLGSQDIADYDTTLTLTREGNAECLIFAENATNITIEGMGVIDGRGTHIAFPRDRNKATRKPRPRLIRMEKCSKLKFSGVTYTRPAFWGIHLVDCKDIHFDAITIRFSNNNYNNDGLDLDGCEEVLIENCDIKSGDDAICLKSSLNPCRNVVVRNCRLSSNTSPFKLGTSSSGGFINVKVSNCYFYDCPMGAIKLELVDGGRLEDIDISRIVMEDVGSPVFIRLGNRGRIYTKDFDVEFNANKEGIDEGVPVGILKNVSISDVVAVVTIESPEEEAIAPYKRQDLAKQDPDPEKLAEKQKARSGPIMITGIPGHYVENVTLKNIEISYPGGGTSEDAKRVVAEDEKRYPEQFFFGVLPAWGAYIRHAKNIQFKNVKMTTRDPDKREKFILIDVEGFITE